ncbi:hypothetical protein LF1_52410 [Rubripirellula obstinata]|uniref:SMI1 / KNR4 family protein n=1 Tax=Rubripirellula obstinata TaxID=406547 RepID=A0A5B1CAT5_9BACT|nr:hypothetical protein [Rubripirellula obstinata]KAA1257392.1 hypothetical protein LF1_52410 [Rubripirellula obstinata]
MNLNAIRNVLDQLDAEYAMGLGDCDPKTAASLSAMGLPSDLNDLFTRHWPQTPGRGHAGPFRLRSTAQLVSPLNTDDLVPRGLFSFAYAGNGDTVALELGISGYPTLIFDHCNWGDELDDLRSIAVGLTLTLPDFFHRAANDPDMPGDYWEIRHALDAHG